MLKLLGAKPSLLAVPMLALYGDYRTVCGVRGQRVPQGDAAPVPISFGPYAGDLFSWRYGSWPRSKLNVPVRLECTG